ncbi:Xylose operon regulatory protein [Rubripirellula lacrimiformis]|uniref:Xylose operon regulatory protein n=1 Tax=Rubripirellula lacrimiformis TaxID=1930273 RepID=A0A517N4K5_9BACT|nr:DNA-binding transcriptional regulator [Rubripirellula lacrimiformis]QDT02069.1 Xylose operon regulatory protein [Rubripirellula lacrimiformis]
MKRPERRVAVLIETDDSWGRRVVASIAQFARQHKWRLLIAPRDHEHRLRMPGRSSSDGVIVSLRDRSMADHIRRSGLPAVDVSIMMPHAKWLARVATDDVARAEMALEHFRQRRLKHFACYAPSIGRYSIDRAHAFRSAVEKAGFQCDVFCEAEGTQGWEIDHDHVIEWLSRLPRPLAVFAADPYPARQLAEICEWNDITVPDDVTILAGDNDDLLCNVSSPQLSSIQLACESIGTEAASRLRQLMNGGAVPTKPKLIEPLYVLARQSTDTFAVADNELTDVLRHIHDHAMHGISVNDVVRKFSLSRRWLELRFQRVLGRSPADHIRRIRMEHIRNLLLQTDLTITQIAFQTGFSSSSSLTQQFTRQFGRSPTAMRADLRPERDARTRNHIT